MALPSDVQVPEVALEKRPPVLARDIYMLVLYFLLLYGLNVLRVVLILPWEVSHLPDLIAALVEIIEKAFIWIGLTYLFIVLWEKRPFLEVVKLKGNGGKGLLWGCVGSVFITLLFILSSLTHHQGLAWHSTTFFAAVPIFDGLIEEIPFRGFLFTKFQQWMPLSMAALLNALLFVLIHIPIWISEGNIAASMVPMGLSIFILALLFLAAVFYSKSLWSSILMHTVNNLLNVFW